MKLLDIFPITVGTATLQSLTSDVIKGAIELIDNSDHFDDGKDGTYTKDQNFLDHPLLGDVKKEVIGLCREFSRSYAHDVQDIGICNSWANVVTLGAHIPSHLHNNSYLSGSLYLTHGSSLSITNPNFLNLFGFMPQVIDNTPRSYAAYRLKPEPGMVIMFPSRLMHGVSPSRATENRYSIAFNAIPLGPIGVPTAQINLRQG